MVKIRLKRLGAKKAPFYRVVVSESRNARNGKSIANIGYYNPMTEPAEIKIDVDAAKDWIAKGAQPSETVKKLLKIAGLE
jgi:small subunit ribosomal protein S16